MIPNPIEFCRDRIFCCFIERGSGMVAVAPGQDLERGNANARGFVTEHVDQHRRHQAGLSGQLHQIPQRFGPDDLRTL